MNKNTRRWIATIGALGILCAVLVGSEPSWILTGLIYLLFMITIW